MSTCLSDTDDAVTLPLSRVVRRVRTDSPSRTISPTGMDCDDHQSEARTEVQGPSKSECRRDLFRRWQTPASILGFYVIGTEPQHVSQSSD